MSLEPGIYLNLFPIEISSELLSLMEKPRSEEPDLRTLRTKIEQEGWNVEIYPEGPLLYGYGEDEERLSRLGFEPVQKVPSDCPYLVCHLISSGLVAHLQSKGFWLPNPKATHRVRVQIFKGEPIHICGGKVQLYQGWDLRAFFWPSLEHGTHDFGLVVDLAWKLRDSATQAPLNFSELKHLYGGSSLIEVAQHQGEYIPGTRKVNFQVARHQFQKRILPFVQSIGEFALSATEVTARVTPDPVWVMIGGDEDD